MTRRPRHGRGDVVTKEGRSRLEKRWMSTWVVVVMMVVVVVVMAVALAPQGKVPCRLRWV
jgi:hypothetical protein